MCAVGILETVDPFGIEEHWPIVDNSNQAAIEQSLHMLKKDK